MSELADERDQLIADLLEEAHGLRMKLEDFSQYTESKVAEFVLTRNALTGERDSTAHRLGLTEHDLAVLRRRQEQMQRDLVETQARLQLVEARVVRFVMQRDIARERVKALEASRAVRIASRLRKILRRG